MNVQYINALTHMALAILVCDLNLLANMRACRFSDELKAFCHFISIEERPYEITSICSQDMLLCALQHIRLFRSAPLIWGPSIRAGGLYTDNLSHTHTQSWQSTANSHQDNVMSTTTNAMNLAEDQSTLEQSRSHGRDLASSEFIEYIGINRSITER